MPSPFVRAILQTGLDINSNLQQPMPLIGVKHENHKTPYYEESQYFWDVENLEKTSCLEKVAGK